MITQHLLANVVWPALYLEARLLSFWVIACGLLVEFFFVRRLVRGGWFYALAAAVAMNLASALAGLILIPLVGLIVVLPVPGTFSPLAWALTFCAAVLVNAFVEGLVLRKVFQERVGGKEFRLLCLANALTVGVAFASFLLSPVTG